MKKTLWTKNFTIITIGTVISAIGGTAMNFAMGLVVFDNTASAWMTGVYRAVSMLPSIVLPILFAPYVDSHRRKPLIVGLDAFLGLLYLAFALYLSRTSFSYGMYMAFGLMTSAVGSLYSTAYRAFYPDLIPEGFMQKGYSVSSMIYPTVTIVVTPVAALVYANLGIHYLILIEGVLLLIAAGFEAMITTDEKHAEEKQRFQWDAYKEKLLGGFRYLQQERGVRSLYTNMSIINATSGATSLMAMTFFQSSPILTTAMYSLVISAETLGRMVGGIVHYVTKIPRGMRYKLTLRVYSAYQVADGSLLFLPYPAMLVVKFCCGLMGVNTATLREAAIQHYLPANIRARVNSLFAVIINVGIVVIQLAAGAMGEVLPFRIVSLIFACIGFASVYFFVIRRRKDIEPLFDAEY